ncbi:MAG: hypothetical protein M3R35_01675 [Candidatus Eremiobacteraeota bacterium]|nr:hypothetical protein [Candidatus Eremiobacteraeota bacterium]
MSLRELPARTIVGAIADAAERWSDADFPPRVRVLDRIVERTGYSNPVVEYALDRLFFSITAPALTAVIENELGSLDALDGFATRTARPRAWARGVDRVAVISSRTTIGVALVPAIFALCAKSNVTVKDREDELVTEFFATLREERDAFVTEARAQAWDGREARDLRAFDVVVAFGGSETLETIRAGLRLETRFIGYGARASAAYVTRDVLNDETRTRLAAAGVARDLVLYDTEGCLSPHVAFVENGGRVTAHDFARLLANEVERASIEFPASTRRPEREAALVNARNLGAFRSAGGAGTVFADNAATYAVFVNPPADEPPLFLPRAIGLHAVDQPVEAAAYLKRHGVAVEAFAMDARGRPDATAMAVNAGAVRLARFGGMQQPPLAGNHGGYPRISGFVRWIDTDV